MGELHIILNNNNAPHEERLWIKRGDTPKINASLTIVQYKDKDTEQHIMYIPALDINAYGATRKKAEEMLKYSIDEFFTYLMELSPKNSEVELRKLGWKHSKLRSKEYSKAYVDVAGNLKDFAAESKVEVGVLTT